MAQMVKTLALEHCSTLNFSVIILLREGVSELCHKDTLFLPLLYICYVLCSCIRQFSHS